ncbi:hypothetical protein GCM10029976_046450 [Kribbella albertanoniae]
MTSPSPVSSMASPVSSGSAADPSLTELSKFMGDGRTVPFMDQLWPNPKVAANMMTGIQEIFSGKSTPDKVLARMDTDYKSGE